MVTIKGKGVFGGIAIGKISFFIRESLQVKRTRVDDPDKEVERLYQARDKAVEELKLIYGKALVEVGEANAQIFEIHQVMLQDQDYMDSIENIIQTQSLNAEYAVAATSDNFSQMFAAMEDEYMKERAADVKDISDRMLRHLLNKDTSAQKHGEKVIICADDLAPSETVQLDKEKVLAFATQRGSSNSHTAILARTMNIPALIGLGDALTMEYDGHMAVVNGHEGCLYIDPDPELLEEMTKRQQEEQKKRELLQNLKGKDNVTLDGKSINIYANIGGPQDLGSVLVNDAGGIGLFRSEFLYLENASYPSEELQFNAYRKVLESMAGKKVIIRTLDIGADKQIDYFKLDKEENPAMGFRAIRICLDRPEIFKTQLRALLRASVYGILSIMFPMITSVKEIQAIKKILEEVRSELLEQEVPFCPETEIGIMIETPAAAVISDILAKEVDFFSIGTNDLTQYTLAVDRQNPRLDPFYDPHHPAILRMIKQVTDNAHRAGIWCGICGELASDLELTETFLAMGVDELSVSPPLVLPLRERIRNADTSVNREQLLSFMD